MSRTGSNSYTGTMVVTTMVIVPNAWMRSLGAMVVTTGVAPWVIVAYARTGTFGAMVVATMVVAMIAPIVVAIIGSRFIVAGSGASSFRTTFISTIIVAPYTRTASGVTAARGIAAVGVCAVGRLGATAIGVICSTMAVLGFNCRRSQCTAYQ